jgi:hypothetical protein
MIEQQRGRKIEPDEVGGPGKRPPEAPNEQEIRP